VPVMIERVRPPAGFREVQAADLIDWDGARDFPGLQQLISDLEQKIGKPDAVRREMLQPVAAPEGNGKVVPLPGDTHDSQHQGVPTGLVVVPVSLVRKLLPWAAAAGVLLVAAGMYWASVRREAAVREDVKWGPAGTVPGNSGGSGDKSPLKPVPYPVPRTGVRIQEAQEEKNVPPLNAAVIRGPEGPVATERDPLPRPPIGSATNPTKSGTSHTNPRCAALTERLALGEALSSDAQSFFNQECKK
jgi:hypothetical protein